MKKKFVLTLALVLMVAVTLTAATPVEVSGQFSYGYEFTFSDPVDVGAATDSFYNTFLAVSGDTWKVTLKEGAGVLFTADDKTMDIKAEIYLDKALANEGIDMGDVGLTLYAGPGTGAKGGTVFNSKGYSSNPTNKATIGTATVGLGVAYGDLGSLYVAMDPTVDSDVVFALKATPLDGVKVAAGYATTKMANVSAAVDVAKLADLDFGLDASVAYAGDFSDSNNVKTDLWADASGSYEGIGLWVNFHTDTDKHDLATKLSYSTTVEGFALGAGVKFSIDDLSDIDLGVAFDASAAYTMGDVKYKLALGYALKGDFTVTPTVTIAF